MIKKMNYKEYPNYPDEVIDVVAGPLKKITFFAASLRNYI